MIRQCSQCHALFDSTYVETECPHKEKGWKLSRLMVSLPEVTLTLYISPQEFAEWNAGRFDKQPTSMYVEVKPDAAIEGQQYILCVRQGEKSTLVHGEFPKEEEPSSEQATDLSDRP